MELQDINATVVVIAITCLISWRAFSNPRLMQSLMMNPWAIQREHQYYRFLTSGFIHKDFMHLFFNMFSFYFFGSYIERDFRIIFGTLGIPYYLLLFCLSIIVSDLPTYFKQRNNPAYNSLGASGGVSSIIFVFIILHPLQQINIYFIIGMPGFILGILYIIYSWYEGKRSRDAINHDAHLYGALFGLVFVAVMVPSSIPGFFEQLKHWSFLRGLF